ncbi:hypothetical protein GCM10027423_50020 [Spirosoma arcticum]
MFLISTLTFQKGSKLFKSQKTARYVVGCDSGKSGVRKAAGLDFDPEILKGIHFLLMDLL